MSMICSLYRITSEQASMLGESPDSVDELLGITPPRPETRVLAKLFSKPARRHEPKARVFEPVAQANTFELDQAWHILHFLLSGGAAEGAWPAAFLFSGGAEVGPDHGYGPARLLASHLCGDIAHFLAGQSVQMLDAAYVPSRIEAADIYWQAASDPAERQLQLDELWSVVVGLRAFFDQTVESEDAMLVSIT